MKIAWTRIIGVTVMLMGAAVLLGWAFGITALTSLSPGWPPMAPNTALAFILAGFSLWLTSGSGGVGPRVRLSAGACAGMVATIGALTLSEHALGWDLGIDRWLLTGIQPLDDAPPARMSYATAISFLMVGATMTLLSTETFRAGWLIPLFILLISMIAGLGFLKYIPGVNLVSTITFNGTMAFATTAGFLVLCVGIYRAYHDRAEECANTGNALAEGESTSRQPRAWTDVVMITLVAVTLGLATIALHYVEKQLIQKEGESLAVSATTIADNLDRILYERYSDIGILARAPVFKGRDRTAISKYLNTMMETYHYYSWLGVVDAKGRIVASTAPASLGEDRSQQGWFKAVRDHGGIHVREAVYPEDAGDMMAIGFTAPIIGSRDEFLGAVTTRISLPIMEHVMAEIVRQLEKQKDFATVEYQLLNREGDLLIDSRLRQDGQVNLQRLAQPSALLSARGENGYIEERHLRRNLPVVTGYASCKKYQNFPGISCGILIGRDRNEILAHIQEVTIKLGLAGAFILAPLLGFLFWSTGRLKTEWAMAQKEAARARAAEAVAQASKEQFCSVTQSANDAIISSDRGGIILSWNKGAHDIFGYEETEVVGKPLTLLMPERYRAAYCLELERVSGTGEKRIVGTTFETPGLRKNGSEFPSELSMSEWKSGGQTFYSSIIRDISERRRTENLMRQTQERLQLALKAGNTGLWLWNIKTDEVELSLSWKSQLGYADGEISNGFKEFETRLHPDDHDRVLQGIRAFLEAPATECVYRETYRLRHRDGSYRWLSAQADLKRDQGGRGEWMVGCNVDITESKKLAESLQINEERLRLIARAAKDLLWDWDVPANVLWWNESMQTALGYRPEEIEPGIESWQNRLHPDERETVLTHIHEVIGSGGNDWSSEYRFRRADDSYSYFLDRRYVLHRDPEGKPLRMLGSMVEITERKRAEETLYRSERLNRNLVAHLPHRIIVKDRDSVILSCNANYAEELGLSPAALIGTTGFALYPSKLAEAYRADDLEVMASGKTKDIEEPYQVDGEDRWVHTVKVPYRDEQQQVIGVLAVFEDITARKQAEAELQQARLAAEAATQAKSAFLAVMSHEIRTPMNGIIGMTGLLLDTPLTPEQQEYADTVRRSSDALLDIINDILDFSKFEAGQVTLETIEFDLRTMIEEALDLFAEPAQGKGLELGCLIHADVPTGLQGDPGRLRQILVNLVANAIKFTQQGEVMIHVSRGEEHAERIEIQFAVTDTGIGIDPDVQALLFKPFAQADTSTTRRFGGTGLGLAICKQLVEQMGGHIGIDSVPNQGSTFRFTVSLLKQVSPAPAQLVSKALLTGRRLCIVDDHAANRRILEEYARQWGLLSASAADGPQALELMREAAVTGAPFDVAILDMQMPGMDGLELARTIKADPALAATSLVLLTSIALRGQAEQAKRAGLAAYLTKPAHRADVYDCLATVMGLSERPPTTAQGDASARSAPGHLVTRHALKEAAARPRILVAEDNIVNQKVATYQLEKLGYRTDVVANGHEAIEAVRRVRYALVLMDCQMPELNGLEATAVIRKGERERRGRRLPIIAMTANAMQEDHQRCLDADMDDFLAKPVKKNDLSVMLAKWIPDQGASRQRAHRSLDASR